jgi:hypothetical protein
MSMPCHTAEQPNPAVSCPTKSSIGFRQLRRVMDRYPGGCRAALPRPADPMHQNSSPWSHWPHWVKKRRTGAPQNWFIDEIQKISRCAVAAGTDCDATGLLICGLYSSFGGFFIKKSRSASINTQTLHNGPKNSLISSCRHLNERPS